jgi:predicted nuclease of predicted toxin-antitoxin system
VRFLLDAQLPPRLAAKISSTGHEAIHLGDILPVDAEDLVVAKEANRLKAVLVSKDEDFVDLARRGVLQSQFLWIRSGNMTTAKLWLILEPLLPDIERAFTAGEKIVEVK